MDHADIADQLQAFIGRARWFGGKGRAFEVTDVQRLALDDAVVVALVRLDYTGGGGDASDLYQVPLSFRDEEEPTLAGALVGRWDEPVRGPVWVYDALQDPAATGRWLRGFADGRQEPVRFRTTSHAHEIPTDTRGTVMRGEQSNTSVVFGDQQMLKVFRRITPGTNPDIEICAALTEAGSTSVAELYGWYEQGVGDDRLELGILQRFLAGAQDGWRLAVDSQRAADGFTAEAAALGAVVAEMHGQLAVAFPTEEWQGGRLDRLADAMAGRLDAAAAVVPELADHEKGLRTLFDAVRDLDVPLTAQRVHGDLHLGQTLWLADGAGAGAWKIIDFEGEPAKSLAERRAPDSAWRDVAGMLRSFDYAAETGAGEHGDPDAARDWGTRSASAFLEGYRSSGLDPAEQVILDAYAADKAVYEAVYEARNRPTWLPIPMAALSRLAAG